VHEIPSYVTSGGKLPRIDSQIIPRCGTYIIKSYGTLRHAGALP
jgi:hypothetical protein